MVAEAVLEIIARIGPERIILVFSTLFDHKRALEYASVILFVRIGPSETQLAGIDKIVIDYYVVEYRPFVIIGTSPVPGLVHRQERIEVSSGPYFSRLHLFGTYNVVKRTVGRIVVHVAHYGDLYAGIDPGEGIGVFPYAAGGSFAKRS